MTGLAFDEQALRERAARLGLLVEPGEALSARARNLAAASLVREGDDDTAEIPPVPTEVDEGALTLVVELRHRGRIVAGTTQLISLLPEGIQDDDH